MELGSQDTADYSTMGMLRVLISNGVVVSMLLETTVTKA